ncbi:YbaN family protein [Vogesella indigofera]|uniref:YbaN family protein n=1 Tax=Vogesella indigofera TaxID=45465 RepID=UPI00234E59B1|nr:YbaN family protein [Vogesella indigofera]MDC7700471.1 YbaN family protein [Vogesella indigofera]
MLWLVAGWLCLLLALIGALLPVMPTTVFVLMAAACFGRSSPALLHWLHRHPRLGPPLLQWQRHHGMTARTKAVALGTVALSFCFSIYATLQQPWLTALLLLVWAGLSLWMWRLPTIPATSACCAMLDSKS